MGEKWKGASKMKKWLILLIGMGVLLTGCTSNEKRNDTTIETKKSTVQSTEQTTSEMKQSLGTSTSESSTTESSTEEVKNTLWDHNKSAQLETFVIQWGKTLGQTYKSYSDTNPVSQYGTPLPNAVIDGSWKFLVDNAQMPIQWSTTGENNGTVVFQLVAVYSDMEISSDMIRHTYFFGFKDNQPKIYITQQNQGNENNYMYFSETQNQQLKQGFVDIVNGNVPQTPVVEETTPESTNSSTTTEQATNSSVISSWESAKGEVLNNKALWMYDSPDKNASNTNLISTNEYMKDPMQDENGSYYSINIVTDDDGNTTMAGGKQFRVYTDGRISQRIGMTNNYQMIK